MEMMCLIHKGLKIHISTDGRGHSKFMCHETEIVKDTESLKGMLEQLRPVENSFHFKGIAILKYKDSGEYAASLSGESYSSKSYPAVKDWITRKLIES